MPTHFKIVSTLIAGFAWTFTALAQVSNLPNQGGNATEKTDDSFRRMTERMPEPTTRPSDNSTAADAQAIRETLGNVTETALAKDGFEGLMDRFTGADRTRLSRNKQIITEHPVLDARIAQFQKDWQMRFNQEFKIIDKNTIYGTSFASIRVGYAPEGARLATERVLPSDVAPTTPHDEIRDRDQMIATVSLAASSAAPAIDVPMVHEPTGWKIDIPDTYTAQEMHDALLAVVTDLDEHRDRWPADVKEASRIVTQRILMAVLNIESPSSTGTGKDVSRDPAQSPMEDRVLNPNAVR